MTLEEKFQKLIKKWETETTVISNVHEIYGNKHYQEIIKLGKDVVPLIFEEMRKKRYNFWFEALRQILGEGPEIPEKSRGRVVEMTDIWLKYAEENNLVKNNK